MTPEEIFEYVLDLLGGIFPTFSITILILIIVLGLLIPLTISILIAVDAGKDPKHLSSGRTRNNAMGFLWFVLSFLFGVIVWILYIFYRTPARDRKPKTKTKPKSSQK